jgi:hypothetical protein
MRYEAASYGAITPTLQYIARTFADAAEASGVAWRIGQMVNASDRIRRSYCCQGPSSMIVGTSLFIGFAGKIESRRADSNR